MHQSFQNSHTIAQHIKPLFSSTQEEFWAFCLDSQLRMRAQTLLFRGSAYSCTIHPRELIAFLCLNHAHSFVIAHNHPFGAALPSSADRRITKQLTRIAQLIEIPLIDHIIIGPCDHYSFADRGAFEKLRRLR